MQLEGGIDASQAASRSSGTASGSGSVAVDGGAVGGAGPSSFAMDNE